LFIEHNESVVNLLSQPLQNCFKGDSSCQWNAPIFRPSWIKNPWTDRLYER